MLAQMYVIGTKTSQPRGEWGKDVPRCRLTCQKLDSVLDGVYKLIVDSQIPRE